MEIPHIIIVICTLSLEVLMIIFTLSCKILRDERHVYHSVCRFFDQGVERPGNE